VVAGIILTNLNSCLLSIDEIGKVGFLAAAKEQRAEGRGFFSFFLVESEGKGLNTTTILLGHKII